MRRLDARGVTLVELVVTLGLTAIVTTSVMLFAITYSRYGARLQSDEETLVTRLNVGDSLRDSLGTSTGLINQNSLADSHANNVDPISGAGYWLTLHAVPGNTSKPAAGQTTPVLYFRRYSVNTAGAYIMNGQQPYEDEYVIYLDGSSSQLKLRSIANPSAIGNRLKTSCPNAAANANCPADRSLASYISSVDKKYFSRTGNAIDYHSVIDPDSGQYIGPDFPSVEVVELTLHLANAPKGSGGYQTQNTTIVRIALRNA